MVDGNQSDWNAFKLSFIKYNKCTQSLFELNQDLFSMKQKFNEAFETYVWSVKLKYKKVNPKVTNSKIIDHVINTCLPDVKVVLGQTNSRSIIELIQNGRNIIHDLNSKRSILNQTLLRASESDPIPAKNQSQPTNNSKYFKKWSPTEDTQSTKPDVSDQSTSKESTPSQPVNTKSTSNSGEPLKTCNYCKKIGHEISVCRRKKWSDDKKAQSSSQNQGNR